VKISIEVEGSEAVEILALLSSIEEILLEIKNDREIENGNDKSNTSG